MVSRFWTQKQDFGPPGADAIVYDTSRQRTMLLVNGNTWEWDGAGWAQLDDMGPRGEQALVYSSARQRLIAFGTTSETWEWDGASWTQLADSGPTARVASAMTYDTDRDRVVLFGGRAGTGVDNLSDTWEWDGKEWTQQEDQGPEGRRGHAMAYDVARKQTVLFGGAIVREGQGMGRVDHNDTWVWNGHGWRQAAGFGPPKRSLHSMAYDDALEQILLFGGFQLPNGNHLGDTWEWNGKRWAQCQDIGPFGRYSARITYDSNRKCMVLFGGGGDSVLNAFAGAPFDAPTAVSQSHDTWELSERLPS
jgi:hypothetical protein